MAGRERCGNCAYADKQGKTMWCPFHDLPIRDNLVCDDFLDTFESPQWKSLNAGLTGEASDKVPQFTGKDVFAYALSLIGILISVGCFVI